MNIIVIFLIIRELIILVVFFFQFPLFVFNYYDCQHNKNTTTIIILIRHFDKIVREIMYVFYYIYIFTLLEINLFL